MPIIFAQPVLPPSGWDLTNASYTGNNYSVQSQDGGPRSIQFSTDGTVFFIVGHFNSGRAHRYTCTTPFDIGAGVSYSGFFAVGSQTNFPEGMSFNDDGTKMFVVGNNTVFEYTLPTAFSFSGASYSGNSFSVASQIAATAQTVSFSTDGLKMFAAEGGTTDSVYEYTLNTAFDLSDTVTYSGNSFAFTSEDTDPTSVTFSPDGLKMFMLSYNDVIYQYTLGSAFDLSGSVTYSGISFSILSQDSLPFGICFSTDGQTLFMTGALTDKVFQYSL